MKIINLTPHVVNIVDSEGNIQYSYSSSKKPARVDTDYAVVPFNEGPTIIKTTFTETINLPKEKDNVWYIVSSLVKQNEPERNDLLVPSHIVKNSNNKVLGCLFLSL